MRSISGLSEFPAVSNYNQTWITGPTATNLALTPLTDRQPDDDHGEHGDTHYLSQKNTGNTILGSVNVTPEVKISAGWRFNDRQIKLNDDDTLDWHENWLLLGGVVNPISDGADHGQLRPDDGRSRPTRPRRRATPTRARRPTRSIIFGRGRW